ncbi:S1 family peptidase [Dokdonella sp.]|uniref:S1 family peptidase n=1 Tax=Dokdonella sp. TaxID=2291710 RepID=UPI003C6EECED
MLSDIRQRVWYIEARSCASSKDFASEDAASMGSGVLVEIEHRGEPKKVRRYLLTCAHVVRRKVAGTNEWGGAVHDEILCWRRGQGYTRTYKDKRHCGDHPDIFRASLSALSPCGGRPDGLPDDLRDAPNDWVLLEIDDPAFQKQGRPVRWDAIDEDDSVWIVGYPGGAGLTRHASGTSIWVNGSIVENLATGPFSQERMPGAGMLSLSGVDETRPGMSGGGIFNASGALVGLHRAADDMAMQRNAIAATHIRDALDTRRNAYPTTPTRISGISTGTRRAAIALLLVAVMASAAWALLRPRDCLLQVNVRTTPDGKIARVVDVTRASGNTESQVLSPGGAAGISLSNMASREPWQLGLRFENAASGKIELMGCPSSPATHVLEEAHVELVPQ